MLLAKAKNIGVSLLRLMIQPGTRIFPASESRQERKEKDAKNERCLRKQKSRSQAINGIFKFMNF